MTQPIIRIEKATQATIDLAIKYIDQSTDDTPFSFLTTEAALNAWRNGLAIIAICYIDEKIVGSFVFFLRNHKGMKYLILTLFNGQDMKIWRDEFVNFIFKIAAENKCTDFYMMGRRGWGRLFPEMKETACIYGHKFD